MGGRDDSNDQSIVARKVVADPPKRHAPDLDPSPDQMARDGYQTLAHAEVPLHPWDSKERGVTYNERDEGDYLWPHPSYPYR